jgi:hypothetical protein
MKYLDLTPDQSRDLATTGRVAVWERMEEQPDGVTTKTLEPWVKAFVTIEDPNRPGYLIETDRNPRTGHQLCKRIPAPYPPGTRAMLNTGTPTQAGGVTVRVGAIVRLTATSCTPERRGEWGWVTVWENEGSK